MTQTVHKFFCNISPFNDIVRWRLNERGWVESKDEEEIFNKEVSIVWKSSNFNEKV